VVGEFEVGGIVDDAPDAVWRLTAKGAGITEEFFRAYYAGRGRAVAIRVKSARRYGRSRALSQYFSGPPPQSYRYLYD
jgi:predicted transcriptional regulator